MTAYHYKIKHKHAYAVTHFQNVDRKIYQIFKNRQ